MKNSPLRIAAVFSWALTLLAALPLQAEDKPTAKGPFVTGTEFPIAVWLQSPNNAAKYHAAGVNLYVCLWEGPSAEKLATLEKAGVHLMCEGSPAALEFKRSPVIVGWTHGDEPDNAQEIPKDKGGGYGPPIAPDKIIADYQRIKAADPSRPVMLNLSQGVAWDGWFGRGPRTGHPEDYPEYIKGADIVSFDIYPATHDKPAIAGKLEYVYQGVTRLLGWAGPQKQVWSCIETSHISNAKVKPTPAQVRSEVWLAIIGGARGLIYFCHQFVPEFVEAAPLNDPEMLAAITKIDTEVQEMAPVIATPTVANGVQLPDGSPLAVMCKEKDGSLYVFAANKTGQPVKGSFTVTQAKAFPHIAEAEGPGKQQRQVEQAGVGGVFTDSFDAYGVHIYRVSK